MKRKCEFPTREGTKVTGFLLTHPLSELPDAKTLPKVRHRCDIPVLIFHNIPHHTSGTILLTDLTQIKQRTSVKANQTAFLTGIPECKLDKKVFNKDELFTVKLKDTFDSYLKIFEGVDSGFAIARINFDLYKFNNKYYEGFGNSCRIVYKKNLFKEMMGIEREFINFLDRLKKCVSKEFYHKLDLKYGFTEFVVTNGVLDEDIDKLSQNPNFLQSQMPNADTDEDEGEDLNNVDDDENALSPMASNNDVSFSINPPRDQSKKDSVVERVVESQIPDKDDDDDDEYSDDDFDVGDVYATAPMGNISAQYSISQDIETDNARNGVSIPLQVNKMVKIRQFATIADLRNACKNISSDDSTIFVVDTVKGFTMVPEVPLVITPSSKQTMGFASFKLYLSDENGYNLPTEFSNEELCRFLGIPSLDSIDGRELQRIKQQFTNLLNQMEIKKVKLRSKTKVLNRGIKLETWCIESPILELI
ncbi:hypothetical protein CORT_0F03130 [Candida orthopsilosis Co 90-125]|uniref:Uncharacterized protein n=1 Tax=Candida orthopsilosis (strain 90-125) TaxID=1136231 RepID=H8X8R2_CANO9|nr:hypothetical protein CORT_0F03130 [Candida orthopsilosis Co 90-125]CCG24537.1 hypothetical protein CORT_0F03130 [Candida orthopsilosis Co 90-125]